jgi:hypothetical protein
MGFSGICFYVILPGRSGALYYPVATRRFLHVFSSRHLYALPEHVKYRKKIFSVFGEHVINRNFSSPNDGERVGREVRGCLKSGILTLVGIMPKVEPWDGGLRASPAMLSM